MMIWKKLLIIELQCFHIFKQKCMIVCNILINEVIKDISEFDCPCFIPDTVDLKLRSHHGRDQANSDDMD